MSLLLTLALAASAAERLPAKEVVDKANKVLRGDSSHARVTMRIETPEWSRELELEAWHKGRTRALIAIHAPPKEKGTRTLRRDEEMWMWMARVERLLKIPPTMMHSSWQGSDFNFEDIVKADSIVKDYEHRILEVEAIHEGGFDRYRIEAIPKPDAPVVWGKVLFDAGVFPNGWIIPLREEDYSERGELSRVIELSEVKEMGGRKVPTRLECVPQKKPGRRTVLSYREIEFDMDLKDSFFGVGRLQK